ncbi:MAG TPA: hypothetical protein VGJ66_12380, partial [Pyrinomonadaceae bacterium]
PINFQPSLVRMLPLGKYLKLTLASGATALGFCITTPKLTLASGATAHGSAWRALKLTPASGATAHGSPKNPTSQR